MERGVKALVVACNTASGLALAHLKAHFAPLPVFGVVEPGAQAAAAHALAAPILVLATESTIQGGAYQRAILKLAPAARIYAHACPLWVALAEQGPVDASLTAAVLQHDLRGWAHRPGTLLLGCTHFPVFGDVLAELYPKHRIVDSAQTTAQVVAAALERRNPAQTGGAQTFLATDGAARFLRVGRHFLGAPIEGVELVDL